MTGIRSSASAKQIFFRDEPTNTSQEELLKHAFKNAANNYEKSTPAIVTKEVVCN